MIPIFLALAFSLTSTAAGLLRPSKVSAERVIYAKLDNALDLVGAPHVDSAGTLTWLAVADTDSGTISCVVQAAGQFDCEWTAKLVQSYRGSARVTYGGHHAVRAVFMSSTCKDPVTKGISLPNLCADDPAPGMPDYGA
jgi:hypothetical protein